MCLYVESHVDVISKAFPTKGAPELPRRPPGIKLLRRGRDFGSGFGLSGGASGNLVGKMWKVH